MAYRVSYVDTLRSPRLVAVAETLPHARSVAAHLGTAVPAAADRLLIAEDPLLGVACRVVQPPESLDAAGGLPVLYLGGTISPIHNWQGVVTDALAGQQVVIANPRREHPDTSQDGDLFQVAWQQRHLWRADLSLFWFEGDDLDPVSLLEFGTQFVAPIGMAIGTSPELAHRSAIRAYLGHLLPERVMHESLEATIAAVVELLPRGRRRFRLPEHDMGTEASALNVGTAIARLEPGPGFVMLLRELVIEVGCAAGHGLDPDLLARIYVSIDRLRTDTDDPLAWSELHQVARTLADEH